jgi:hypothetical protein
MIKRYNIEIGIPDLEFSFIIDEMQNSRMKSGDTAFVLPVNTYFVDDCITDKNSVLGSFFFEFHPTLIPTFSEYVKTSLEYKEIFADNSGNYPVSSTIILPPIFNTPCKVILTASTTKSFGEGFRSNPVIITSCIEQIYKVTADQRISNIVMPILGSGRGGLEISDALTLIILSIKFYSKKFHHIKKINLHARKADFEKINDRTIQIFNLK